MCTATASVAHIASRISRACPRTIAPLITDAALYLADACVSLGIDPAVNRIRTNSTIPCTAAHIASALIDFAQDPSRETARHCYRVISAHSAVIIRRSDSTVTRLLSPDVSAPLPPKPHIQRAPAGSLDWQTQPVIGIDPAIWAEGMELSQALEKRDKRITGSPKRERPVTSPSQPMGRGKIVCQPAMRRQPRPVDLDTAVRELASRWGSRLA